MRSAILLRVCVAVVFLLSLPGPYTGHPAAVLNRGRVVDERKAWSLARVSWDSARLKMKRGDTAKLSVEVSASGNIDDNGTVTVTVKIVPDGRVGESLGFTITPSQVIVRGVDLKTGRTNTVHLDFNVTLASGNPPTGGVFVFGRASLEGAMNSAIAPPPFKDSSNKLLLVPADG